MFRVKFSADYKESNLENKKKITTDEMTKVLTTSWLNYVFEKKWLGLTATENRLIYNRSTSNHLNGHSAKKKKTVVLSLAAVLPSLDMGNGTIWHNVLRKQYALVTK